MKKLLFIAAVAGITGLAQATTISSGITSIDGANAYSWGISIAVPNGQTVSSAEIDFTSVQLTSSGNAQGTGVLWTDLLNSHTPGVTSVSDGDAAGDYWSTKFSGANITSLGSKNFASVGTTLTWSYVITGSALAALNSYLAAGSFDIGIDPDCHYTIGGISFKYSLSPTTNNVPDFATTAFLMVIGLAGLEVFRRQFVLAKSKA